MVVVEVNGYTIEPETDLSVAILEGSNLTAAFADEDTTWPGGFDPQAAGVMTVLTSD